ncbi:hypothetical protein [Kribbella kalugense]|uniref:Uncharacterized protein n=1 Tax=Kribbella kalugense TaxID=2512221 RepID=A0A4R7ZJM7_9ACTN|nr:hypothetical protein [Kribbella kalugense]TDW17977.1 hypothetical protein EV650_4557 [Kribbella kalugense]
MKKLGILAGALFVAYGIIRLIDGANGDRGPGLAWTSGHLLFLLGLLLFGAVLVVGRNTLTSRRPLGTAAMVVGLVGVAAFVRVILTDLIVGFRASDHAQMSAIGGNYDRWPGNLGIYEPLQTLGPILFLVGLLTLAVLLTVERRLPVWAAPVLVAGFVLISANLDLMPIGGALLGLAFSTPRFRPGTLRRQPS